MNEHFAIRTHRGVSLLVYLPWWDEGIVHGMTLADLDFTGAGLPASERALCEALEVNELAVPQQVHGDRWCDLRVAAAIEKLLTDKSTLFKGVESDALVFPTTQPLDTRRIAFGVMAADCVPILVRSDTGWAAIHAGWRGLACRVIAKTLGALNGITEGAVFAAAGGERYEVGQEVIDAIGPTAACCKTADGKYLLDTAATAINQLREFTRSIRAEAAGLCTISDERFHSFRRQGERCGRSLIFVVPRT